jgi:hypothetical protein
MGSGLSNRVIPVVVALALLASCGDEGSAPQTPDDLPTVVLALQGFVGQPAVVASTGAGGLRYAGAQFALTAVDGETGATLFDGAIDGADVVVSVSGGVVTASATVPLSRAPRSATVTGEVRNGAGERLYTLGEVHATFAADALEAAASASLTYVGPGQDVMSLSLDPGTATLEVYSFESIVCRGTRADGSTTTDFPRLLLSDNENIATVNPVTGTLFGQNPGMTNVECRFGIGTVASARAPVTITDRSPTPPVTISLEEPASTLYNAEAVVPIGTRVPIRIRLRDAEGNYAAGALVLFTLSLGGGIGSVEPSEAVTGNDGTAEAVFTVGPLLHSARASVPGTTLSVSIPRFGQ